MRVFDKSSLDGWRDHISFSLFLGKIKSINPLINHIELAIIGIFPPNDLSPPHSFHRLSLFWHSVGYSGVGETNGVFIAEQARLISRMREMCVFLQGEGVNPLAIARFFSLKKEVSS